MNRPLLHDDLVSIARCLEGQPDNSWRNTSKAHRASNGIYLIAAAVLAILGVYTVADWRLDDRFNHLHPRDSVSANNGTETIR